MTDNRGNAVLRVSTHVLIQLGRELVTDTEQAILECVKNAYDADSPDCTIEVNTTIEESFQETLVDRDFSQFLESAESVTAELINPNDLSTRELTYKGKITITDKGDGISADQIESSWLVISTSGKRAFTEGPKNKTGKGRTPLGDKGLGRLSTMKLGDILLVESATSTEEYIHSARFRWKDCETAYTIDQIPVITQSRPNLERFKGTRVSILGLNDLNKWRHKNKAFEISQNLMRFISPFETTSKFPVIVDVDGQKNSLASLTEDLFKRAVADFSFEWKRDEESDQFVLIAKAKLKSKLFTEARGNLNRQKKIDLAFTPDQGKRFLEFLKTTPSMKRFTKTNINSRYFIELEEKITWNEIVKNAGEAISPGSFGGEFHFFHIDIDDDIGAGGEKFDKNLVKAMSGISILRDGFLVRSTGDWLGLADSATSGSIYHMRPQNTIGYFALTGEHNFQLVEKSDREGFIDNSAYSGFEIIAMRCKKFANDCLNNSRRGLDLLYTRMEEKAKETNPKSALHNPFESIRQNIESNVRAKERANTTAQALKLESEVFKTQLDNVKSKHELIERIDKWTSSAIKSVEVISSTLEEQPHIVQALDKIRFDIDKTQEQMIRLYESAAVGLSARGLAHELRIHLTEIRIRMNNIQKTSKTTRSEEKDYLSDMRAIRASCAAMTNSIALIDPMLPRTRTIKETLDLSKFITEYIKARQTGLEHYNIDAELLDADKSITIRCNRGRILQVVDNLVRNSVYWLNRGHEIIGVKRTKRITIQFTESGFIVSDTGPGIDHKVEDSLFEIFVSAKPEENNDGQGLGLFICKQLLDDLGGDVQLLPDRNEDNKRFKFAVDLTGLIHGVK